MTAVRDLVAARLAELESYEPLTPADAERVAELVELGRVALRRLDELEARP